MFSLSFRILENYIIYELLKSVTTYIKETTLPVITILPLDLVLAHCWHLDVGHHLPDNLVFNDVSLLMVYDSNDSQLEVWVQSRGHERVLILKKVENLAVKPLLSVWCKRWLMRGLAYLQ